MGVVLLSGLLSKMLDKCTSERDSCEHCGTAFEAKHAGRTFYGTEFLIYLD